jgi:hypothetical protein
MFINNPKTRTVQLCHERFVPASGLDSLKEALWDELLRCGATRGVLRVLTEGPVGDERFHLEASIPTPRGRLAFFGLNHPSRAPSEQVLATEMTYLSCLTESPRREIPQNLEIVRLIPDRGAALELESLYASTYSDYPVPLDAESLEAHIKSSLAFAVMKGGNIVSALFGMPFRYGDITAVEFTLCATEKTVRGIGMTTALAARIQQEAMLAFDNPIMLAETIAAPVMHSCHDLGMSWRGVLLDHFPMTVGNRTFSNLHVWSL